MHKYLDIAEELRREIESGRLEPGERLGSVMELMAQFDTTRETIFGAVATLRAAGLVKTRSGPGAGIFVTTRDERRPPSANPLMSWQEAVLGLIMRMAEDRDEQHMIVTGMLESIAQRLDLLTDA